MLLTGLEPLTIGRDPSNSLSLKDERLSRFHCVIERAGDSFIVHDLQSRNGTLLNGQRIDASPLHHGDNIQIGRVKIHFLLQQNKVKTPRDPTMTQTTEASSIDPQAAKPPHRIATGDHSVTIDWQALEAPESQLVEAAVLKSDGDPIESYEQLQNMIDSTIGYALNSTTMALINARGQTTHESNTTEKQVKVDPTVQSVSFLRRLLLVCLAMRATDLHVEPRSNAFQVRVRVDGVMVSLLGLHQKIGNRLLRLVKVLCDINIAQINIVQEGHFSIHMPDRHVDLRVSFTPSMYGQKLVVRVLDLANAPKYLGQMHLPESIATTLKQIVQQDTGMVLLCGPTGSGKTTTLYALLRDINVSQRNVITIEDPVEYQIEGVTQLPVNEAQGNSFSNLLRSVLRQDPDVILVGEIRDPETASIALQAAMTGHLVLSTVHARDTIGTLFRLLNLGVEPYMVATGVNLLLAQRLVRQLCPHCKRAQSPTSDQIDRLVGHGVQLNRLCEPVGCPKCLKTGYRGRRGAFEMLTVTDEVRDTLLTSPQIHHLHKTAQSTSFISLMQSGYQMVAQGITSLQEMDQVVGGL